jgi:hypothetical protein
VNNGEKWTFVDTAGVADAHAVAGGPVYATPTAGVVACYIFNAAALLR